MKKLIEPTPAYSLRRDFRGEFSWRIFRIMAEFIEGFQFLADLKKEVTIFGSARFKENDQYYKEARKLGRLLGEAGYTIITGGGPGIMEAGNRGASEVNAPSIGLNIQLPREQRTNKYVKKGIGFYYFFTRKVMLSASAQAYVFFPGGFGTVDEFMELTVLIQTQKMEPIPIVLVGLDFWSGLLKWIEKKMLKKYNVIIRDDLKIYTLVDSAEEAYTIIAKTKERAYY